LKLEERDLELTEKYEREDATKEKPGNGRPSTLPQVS
jgi:hypothetical protein